MNFPLPPVCASTAVCKCCGASSPLYGVVDFNKNCSEQRGRVLGVSGVPIYYYRCPQCGFIFTTAFDRFTAEDFSRHIYNQEYRIVDPDYEDERSRNSAALLGNLFPSVKPARMLDYGGGSGRLAGYLRGNGFPGVDVYDPFVPQHAVKPQQKYPCIVSFEVLEHSTHPGQTVREMDSLLADVGLILFSTLLQPADIEAQGLSWWYAGPRNGHVSLFSRNSLLALVRPLGVQLASFNDNLHLLFRQIPDFARHWFP
jgi:2-polyprenyl-6-hydroxyphenyl methylase/3-demethylubiquinone-9 3-methyltransferase